MRRLMVLSLGLLLVPGLALAQKVDAAGTPYRGWDVDTGVGFHNMSHDDGGVNPAGSGDYWNYSWAGTIDVAIPKLREGTFFPEWLLERHRRAEAALTTVVAEPPG